MDQKPEAIRQWLKHGSINIFGLPFSGKDTQARKLANLVGGVLVGGGDILRSHKDPKEIERTMARGGIIPSDFYLNMVLPYLSQDAFKDKPLILSAVGRSSGEETIIIKATEDSGHPLKAVVLLRLDEDEVWNRFEAAKAEHDRGERTDDHREVLKNRLKKFAEKTAPVIEFYREKELLVEVDGSLSREEVTEQIIDSLFRLTQGA